MTIRSVSLLENIKLSRSKAVYLKMGNERDGI